MKRLIRISEVLSTTGLCRSEIYRLMAEGKFPKAVPISEKATAWEWSEVQEWVTARIAARERLTALRAATGRRLVGARERKRQAAAAPA